MLTPDDIRRLEMPLALEHHEARAKGKDKSGKKQQWLIYITQEGIIPLLNEIDPSWTWEVREASKWEKYAVVTGRLTIKDVYRDGRGGNRPNSATASTDEDTEKGAETDALKRAAVKFGVGLYLRGVESIWVDITEKTWEDEKVALDKFAAWYRRAFGALKSAPTLQAQLQAQNAPTPASGAQNGKPDPKQQGSNGSTGAGQQANGGFDDESLFPPNTYRVTEVKCNPQGSSHVYLLKSGATNIALYGGDLFRAIKIDPKFWQDNPGKWFEVKPALNVTADFDGKAWQVHSLAHEAEQDLQREGTGR